MNLHSSARLLIYVFSALALPGLSFFYLALLLMVLVWLLSHRFFSALSLAVRAKWLFLLIFLGYAYNLPGQAALPLMGEFSPSLEGLMAGGLQMLRLLLLLLLLDLLVLSMPRPRLLSGLYALFCRLERFGVRAERATVRLGLTLQAIEQPFTLHQDIWQRLACVDAMPSTEEQEFVVVVEPWRPIDSLALAGGAFLVMGIWLVA